MPLSHRGKERRFTTRKVVVPDRQKRHTNAPLSGAALMYPQRQPKAIAKPSSHTCSNRMQAAHYAALRILPASPILPIHVPGYLRYPPGRLAALLKLLSPKNDSPKLVHAVPIEWRRLTAGEQSPSAPLPERDQTHF